MSGPRLVSLLLLLAAVVVLVVLLFSLERYYRRHATWVAHQRALAGTEQQDNAALAATGYCPHGFPADEHPPNCDTEWEDAGPPHYGPLCLAQGWLCRYPAGDGHSNHGPYVEGQYLRRATTTREDTAA